MNNISSGALAREYIEKFLKNYEISGQDIIEANARKDILLNFKEHYAKNKGLSKQELIKSENAINFAINLYNLNNYKENKS